MCEAPIVNAWSKLRPGEAAIPDLMQPIFLILPDCKARIPCYTAASAYLRSFAGVSIRR